MKKNMMTLAAALILPLLSASATRAAVVDETERGVPSVALAKQSAEAAAQAKTRSQIQALQDYGLPPSVYIQDPSKLEGAQALVSLYSFPSKKAAPEIDPMMAELMKLFPMPPGMKGMPSAGSSDNPTKVGIKLLDVLDKMSQTPGRVEKITKKKLYMMLLAIRDYQAKADQEKYKAYPELLAVMEKRIWAVADKDFAADTDLAGLGKDKRSLRDVLRQKQEALRSAMAIMEKNKAEKPVADMIAFMKVVEGEMATLQVDENGGPLIPATLVQIVKAIPEKELTQRQWQALFEAYPMGKSLWADRVDKLWRNNVTGAGVTIAILDTGIDKDHPFLKGNVQDGIDGSNFTNHRYIDHAHRTADGKDRFGTPDYRGVHGTHVASTIAAYVPEAKIINIKVLDEEASDDIPEEMRHDNMMTIKAIENGLKDVYDHNAAVASGKKKGSKIDIISMSLGIPESNNSVIDRSNPDSLTAMVKKLSDQGVIVVVAAGNESAGSLRRPAVAPEAITVGAVDYFGRITDFSSSETVLNPKQGTVMEKPDVWTYGLGVNGAKFDKTSKYAGKDTEELSVAFNGTSMATPHAAAITAIVKAEGRRNGVELNAAQVKKILQVSADPLANGNPYARSEGGIIDPSRALAYLKENLGKLKKGTFLDATPAAGAAIAK